MSVSPKISISEDIIYPDSDGKPVADNTRQADEMIRLKTNLDDIFADRDDVFVAMDLLWYAEQGHPEIRIAPDVFVAFGRPKGYRGSYRQWQEDSIAPQVVFEILSPGNRVPTRREGCGEMVAKSLFYDQRGVEEYYLYNPEDFEFSGWVRSADENHLVSIEMPTDWTSPRLGVRFVAPGNREWELYRPDGTPFLSLTEVRLALEQTQLERDQAEAARVAAEERANRLAARLRELGIDPNGE